VTLNLLGQEHVYLAGAAFSAAIAGRQDEYKVAADAVDQNTQELGKAVGSVYGSDAQQKFLSLWRAHIGFFADYAMGAAANDQAKKEKAMSDLQGYQRDIGAFFNSANPNLPAQTVSDLFGPHVMHLTGAIDALAAKDNAKAYQMVYEAAHQTQDIMDPLAAAIIAQFPDKLTGTATGPAADLRVSLDDLAQEHVYLAGYAFNAAIAGRQDEYKVATDAVDMNTQALGKAIGSVYGSDAQQKFLSLWRAHIGFFADYATGAATNDQAKKDKAMSDLKGYQNDIDALLTGANPNLPKGSVAKLFEAHVMHLTGVEDALAAKDDAKAYSMLHEAAHQSQEIGDALAAAIAKQFPDKFPMAAAPAAGAAPAAAAKPSAPATAAQPAAAKPAPAQQPMMQMPTALPRAGEAPTPWLPIMAAAMAGLILVGGGLMLVRQRR
jgi:hypothetical protein